MTMTGAARFDELMERINTGGGLSADEIGQLATAPDILPLGMLADAVRRRLHDAQVTYLRVAFCAFDQSFADNVGPAAREIRVTGKPESLAVAASAVESAKAVAGERTVSAFSWNDIERLASAEGTQPNRVVEHLKSSGLDAVAEVPLDHVSGVEKCVETLASAGYQHLRLTIEKASAADRTALLVRASALQERFACIHALNPLPTVLHAFRPSTGYEDVRMVAIARLAAPNIPTVQVDWLRYGPKLAQVALTFGADDLDGVSSSDDAPEGRRRAPLEEVRRNIEAAGFTPAERDGRFVALA
jgi:2-iminoacetate synthase ThiH